MRSKYSRCCMVSGSFSPSNVAESPLISVSGDFNSCAAAVSGEIGGTLRFTPCQFQCSTEVWLRNEGQRGKNNFVKVVHILFGFSVDLDCFVTQREHDHGTFGSLIKLAIKTHAFARL